MAVERVLNSTAKEASGIPQSTPLRDDGSATSVETGKGSMAEMEKVHRFHLCVKLSGSICQVSRFAAWKMFVFSQSICTG